MSEPFPGTVTLPDGRSERVEVVFDDADVRLLVSSAEVGSWPLHSLRVTRTSPRQFRLEFADEEPVLFTPQKAIAFGSAVARRVQQASLAERIDAMRHSDEPESGDLGEPGEPLEPGEPPAARPPRDASPPAEPPAEAVVPRPGVRGVVLLAGGVAVVLLLAWVVSGRGRGAPQGAPSTAPTSTSVLAGSGGGVFDSTPTVFVDRWNLQAKEFNAPIRIRTTPSTGSFEAQLTAYVMLQGSTRSDGTLASVAITTDPAGGPDDDQLAMASWGITIAVASPELDAAARGRLLDGLGLDLEVPDLTGLDGEKDVGGVRYTLRYLETFKTILFTASPAPAS